MDFDTLARSVEIRGVKASPVRAQSHLTVSEGSDDLLLEKSTVIIKIIKNSLCAPPKKANKSTLVEMQRRLKKPCKEYAASTTAIEDFLQAVGHTI